MDVRNPADWMPWATDLTVRTGAIDKTSSDAAKSSCTTAPGQFTAASRMFLSEPTCNSDSLAGSPDDGVIFHLSWGGVSRAVGRSILT